MNGNVDLPRIKITITATTERIAKDPTIGYPVWKASVTCDIINMTNSKISHISLASNGRKAQPVTVFEESLKILLAKK